MCVCLCVCVFFHTKKRINKDPSESKITVMAIWPRQWPCPESYSFCVLCVVTADLLPSPSPALACSILPGLWWLFVCVFAFLCIKSA